VIRAVACVLGAMLFAGAPALADEPPMDPALTTGSWVICIGQNACSQATDEHCDVALGENTQFPPHASHVLVTPKGIWSLQRLDDRIVRMINRQIALRGGPLLDAGFIERWNDVCSGFTGVPMS
jgi:hypothetical protein